MCNIIVHHLVLIILFQTFKQYREMFDAQKALIEDRYRGLLEESIHDAVYMSSRHNDLTVENDILKQGQFSRSDHAHRQGTGFTYSFMWKNRLHTPITHMHSSRYPY